ncbi:MAG: methylated-DNA--[protein]-cysteine S-methyltransferase [Proteobacteria bacterium]|nr:methylated-DNA--[protein]-cysteine S-methyltransferase [Pseudomonadota bacterium]
MTGNPASPVFWHRTDSPVGPLLLAGTAKALLHIKFLAAPSATAAEAGWVEDARPFAAALTQLKEYFAGSRRAFDLPLAPEGTPFQLRVWQALRTITYGSTVSYGELARRLGMAGGARAVGLANGANPLPIIVPCHRVIGADGSLTGFGGGLPIKRALLELEGAGCVADLFGTRVPSASR